MIGPLAYIGGKRRLARTLIRLFPAHITYVEPFCGGAQVFFHKIASRVEVLNDLDGEIVNFLRICQRHPAELLRLLRFLVPSRSLFGQFAAQDPDQLTDVERAGRFLYLQKNAFAGQRRHRSFHYCVEKPSNFNPRRLPAILKATAARLARVQLESWPYERVLERYDRRDTFFLIDPPYYGISLYRLNLSAEDFSILAERLKPLRGRFLLTINETNETLKIFGGFETRTVPVVYTANRSVPTVRELLVANYPLPSPSLLDTGVEGTGISDLRS